MLSWVGGRRPFLAASLGSAAVVLLLTTSRRSLGPQPQLPRHPQHQPQTHMARPTRLQASTFLFTSLYVPPLPAPSPHSIAASTDTQTGNQNKNKAVPSSHCPPAPPPPPPTLSRACVWSPPQPQPPTITDTSCASFTPPRGHDNDHSRRGKHKAEGRTARRAHPHPPVRNALVYCRASVVGQGPRACASPPPSHIKPRPEKIGRRGCYRLSISLLLVVLGPLRNLPVPSRIRNWPVMAAATTTNSWLRAQRKSDLVELADKIGLKK